MWRSWVAKLGARERMTAIGNSAPLGFGLRTWEFWRERQYLARLSGVNEGFSFGAEQRSRRDSAQVIVLVIGESSRFDRWGLNGYARDTTPLLSKEKNLLSLSDLITSVSATRLSVPVILSRKPSRQSLNAGFSEKSLVSAFREAGYKTFWLSNQMSFGEFDTPISVFAREADVTRFFNLGGYADSPSHDDVLLAPLQAAIDDSAKKKLIVLHSLGSHWNYGQRYPKEFDRWQPSLFGSVNAAFTDLALKEALNNSYDNSVLYTDWFLSKVIDSLKRTNEVASMMYVADHGQSLYDGDCRIAFHGHNTQYEFHVPALVWFSNSYERVFPKKIRVLHQHRDSRLSTENVFHSLLDMADIRYPSEQLGWSFFSPHWTPHQRFVDSYGWTNYDDATMEGACREVIRRQETVPSD
ncbi:Sulfatase [Noviherbaspirillum humi]|uniref:Sulfatase n=2 Tax=Noviherbaspirillum humi TaxID=1688639 RepID=A0A239MAP5_9BURK|nr:Sulfatase [Noviherbaspirillum humi]